MEDVFKIAEKASAQAAEKQAKGQAGKNGTVGASKTIQPIDRVLFFLQ